MSTASAFWAQQRVIVTGGAGFLGQAVVRELVQRGAGELFVPRKADFDLRQAADVARLYATFPATLVVHLAATVGGIGINREHPGSFFYDNLLVTTLPAKAGSFSGYARPNGPR